MKKETKNNLTTFSWLFVLAMVMFFIPEFAMAQNVNKILNDGYFKPIITFGLGIFAAWKWFQYFAGFDPGRAFTDIIVPAIITFLAFKWQEVLKWFSITTV